MHAGIAQIGMHHRGDGLAGGHAAPAAASAAESAIADAIVRTLPARDLEHSISPDVKLVKCRSFVMQAGVI